MAGMNSDLLKIDLAALGEQAWRWWIDELRGVWDHSFLKNFGKEADLPVVTLAANGTLEVPEVMPERPAADMLGKLPGIAALMGRAALARPVTLQLSPRHFLHCQLELPTVTSRVLPNLLKFEIERHTPLALSDTCFGYRIIGRNRLTNRMTVDLFVAKLRAVNHAAEAAQDRGLRIARLVALEPGGTAVDMPEFGAQLPAIHLDHHGRLAAVLAGVAVVLLALTAWSYSAREDRLNAALQDEMVAAQDKAERIEALSHHEAMLEHGLHGLEKRKADTAITPILEAVAKVLPDDSWLNGTEVEGTTVTLSGFSGAAFKLPAIFNASGLFANARLLGPVEHDAGDPADRFDMAADYRAPGRAPGSGR